MRKRGGETEKQNTGHELEAQNEDLSRKMSEDFERRLVFFS